MAWPDPLLTEFDLTLKFADYLNTQGQEIKRLELKKWLYLLISSTVCQYEHKSTKGLCKPTYQIIKFMALGSLII